MSRVEFGGSVGKGRGMSRLDGFVGFVSGGMAVAHWGWSRVEDRYIVIGE